MIDEELRAELLELLWGLANRDMGFSKFTSEYIAELAEKVESIGEDK